MGFRGSLCPKGLCVQRQPEQLREPYQGYPETVLTVSPKDLTKGQESRAGFQDELQPDSVLPGMETKETLLEANTEVPSKGRDLGAAAASAGAACLAVLGVTTRTTSFPDPRHSCFQCPEREIQSQTRHYPKGPYVP